MVAQGSTTRDAGDQGLNSALGKQWSRERSPMLTFATMKL